MFRVYGQCVLAALASVVAIGGMASSMAAPVTVFSDTFSGDAYNAYEAGDDLVNWNVTQGRMRVINCSSGFDPCLSIDASADETSKIVTKSMFAFEAGATYEMSFRIPIAGDFDSFTISIGSIFSKTYDNYNRGFNDAVSFVAGLSEMAALTIMTNAIDANEAGPYITSIALLKTADAPPVGDVPLPGAFVFMASALGGAGWFSAARGKQRRKEAL